MPLIAALEAGLLADLERDELERARADRMLDEVLAVLFEVAVDDQARIVRHAGNDGDVGLLERQLDRMVVHLGDRAVAGLLGRRVDQRRHARGHRIAFDGLVAPAVDIEDNVVGGEGVAVVPGHALAHVQNVFGRVGVDVPYFEQRRLEGEFAGVGDERIEELPGDIAHFRPVVGARVLLVLDEHADPQDAALLWGFGEGRRRRGEAEHAIGGGGRGAENRREREKFAPVNRARPGVGGPGLEAFSPKLALERFSDHCLSPPGVIGLRGGVVHPPLFGEGDASIGACPGGFVCRR